MTRVLNTGTEQEYTCTVKCKYCTTHKPKQLFATEEEKSVVIMQFTCEMGHVLVKLQWCENRAFRKTWYQTEALDCNTSL